MPSILIGLNENRFISQVKEKITHSPDQLAQILTEATQQELSRSIAESIGDEQLVGVKVTGGQARIQSLREAIDEGGYPLHQIQAQIDLIPGATLRLPDIEIGETIVFRPNSYTTHIPSVSLKRKRMKTRARYVAELFRPAIPDTILLRLKNELGGECLCPEHLLRPVEHNVWEWLQQFACVNCGTRYLCECFRPAVNKYHDVAKQQQSNYSEAGWPHKFLTENAQAEYRDGICHLCTDKPSDLFFCHPMYGSPVKVKYGAYMRKLELQDGLSEREAENAIREQLGIPKIGEGWVSETQLFRLVDAVFADYKVVREASPDWLGKQRLDIYIPDLALAIEYQGEQHYHPIQLFGGEEGLKRTKQRDRLKRKLCRDNGVKLIYFTYKDDLSQTKVEQRLVREIRMKQPKKS